MKTLQDIKKIAVLGAGTMGPGIAQVYAMGGYQVTMWTRSEATREKAKAALRAQLDTFAQEEMCIRDRGDSPAPPAPPHIPCPGPVPRNSRFPR